MRCSSPRFLSLTFIVKVCCYVVDNPDRSTMLTGDAEFIEAFKTLADGAVKADTTALHEFASALNNHKFTTHARNVQHSVLAFLKFIEQSQKLGAKERETVRQTDAIGQEAIEPMEAVVQLANQTIETQRTSAVTAITAIVIIGILAFLGMSILIVRRVTKPLNQVVAGLKDIAEGEGDLTNRLTVKSRDEMGELAHWFNIFIEKIQSLMRDMAQHAARLQTSSQELLGISEHMSGGAEQTSLKANTVSDAGEQMSVNMNSVASKIYPGVSARRRDFISPTCWL